MGETTFGLGAPDRFNEGEERRSGQETIVFSPEFMPLGSVCLLSV